MNSSIFQKLSLRTSNSYYPQTSTSFKIKGTLLEKQGDSIKLQLGEDKIIEAQLKEEVKGEVGDIITIDKKNIVKSKLHTENKPVEDKPQSEDNYQILEKLGIPINEETKEALSILEKHGVEITKENIHSFIVAKASLEKVVEGMDYDTALRLLEKNIDVKEEAIQNVANAIEGVNKEERGFSILKFITRKKEMPLEDAEKIAYKLYGNKMGKDITDTIRALYKSGMEITKKNIEKINDILNKLHSLQNLDEDTIIDSVKNKIDATIDNLYKLKNAIGKNVIESKGNLSRAAMKSYDTVAIKPSISDRDLRLMEEDIKSLLSKLKIKVSEESINKAKLLIKKGIDISKENMERVEDIRSSIQHLNKSLDYQKTTLLLKADVSITSTDVVKLSRAVKEISLEEEFIEPQKYEIQTEVEKDKKPMEAIIKTIQTIGSKKESVISLLLKNARPVNIQEVYNTSLFLNNENQIGEEVKSLLDILNKSNNEVLKNLEGEMREFLQQETREMKQGNIKIERVYQQLGKWVREVESNISSLDPGTRDIIQKSRDRLVDSLELQSGLSKDDTVLQLPIVMENNVKNLQIYIMNRKRNNRKIDPNNMSVLLHFDTNNMGEVNIYTAVTHKNVIMKIGLPNEADKNLFMTNRKSIEDLLDALGYQLKEISFRLNEENHILSMAAEESMKIRRNYSFLDVKI